MNGVGSDLILFAKRGVLNDVEGAWVAIGIGVVAILVGVFDFFRGRTSASYRDRCGWVHYATIDGEQNPIQFLIRVMMSVLIGTALITYGVWKLIG
jgi:hypothetical protein